MEIIIEITFQKGKGTKKIRTKNSTTARNIIELMIKNGWKYANTQFLLNI